MLQLLEQWTSLPNLHPAVVHFPIALTPAAWLLDAVALVFRRHRDWLGRAATVLWLAAAGTAGAAYWAGRRAADSLSGVAPQAQGHIATHSDWGLYSLWVIGGLAALRLAVFWLLPTDGPLALRSAFVAVGLGGVAAIAYTADLGGGLVFKHGVAVESPRGKPHQVAPATAESPPEGGSPGERLQRSADGAVLWEPIASDGGALGSVLQAVEGAAAEVVRAVGGTGDTAPGLLLAVEGRTLLRLEGTFGDVEVAAVVEPESFEGSIGLAHHVAGSNAAGLFVIRLPEGEVVLKTLASGGGEHVLDRAAPEVPRGPLELSVTAAGRHLRGTLGGMLVVHGHEPPLEEGAVGILLDGRGRVRLVSLRVTPIRH